MTMSVRSRLVAVTAAGTGLAAGLAGLPKIMSTRGAESVL